MSVDEVSPAPDGRSAAANPLHRLPAWARFLPAMSLAAAGVLLRPSMDPLIGVGTPYILCYPAVILAALYLGRGPALVCVIACVIGALFFVLPAQGRLPAGGQELASLGLFLFIALMLVWLGDRHARASAIAEHAVREARDTIARLESETLERRRAEDALHVRNEELQTTIEELEVTEEELRTQNDELSETRRQLDSERRRYQGLFELAPDAYVVTDAKGVIREANRAAGTLLCTGPAALPGEPLIAFIAEDGQKAFRDALETLKTAGGQQVWECRVCPSGAAPVDVSIAAAPERDGDGQIVGFRCLLRDVTERRRADEARARLAAIVECSDDAIISKDLNGIVTSWNRGAERLFGYTASEMIGRPIATLIPPALLDEEPTILARLRRGQTIDHYQTQRVRKDGSRVEISLMVSPIRDATGRITGASKIARDVTESVRAERALRESEERLRLVAAERQQALDQLATHRDRLEELVQERTRELQRSHEALRLSERMAWDPLESTCRHASLSIL